MYQFVPQNNNFDSGDLSGLSRSSFKSKSTIKYFKISMKKHRNVMNDRQNRFGQFQCNYSTKLDDFNFTVGKLYKVNIEHKYKA